MEQQLGAPDDAALTDIQAQYGEGALPSEVTFNLATADKFTLDLAFVVADFTYVDGPTSLKSGTRPDIVEADAFNTSTDVKRFALAQVVDGDEAPTPLFAYLEEATITLNNNITPNKAVGVIGAFEFATGDFQVSGSMTAYFADVAAVESVRNNADITLDYHLVKANSGISVDIPLLSLGDGRPNIEKDQSIKLPLSLDAASGAKVDSTLDHTMLMVFYDYLPTRADD
jgi:hypothetical protein